jgi:hypothetical protein
MSVPVPLREDFVARIRVCSNVVLTALSPALRNRFIPPRPDLMMGLHTRAQGH